jgi:hypothetical protein
VKINQFRSGVFFLSGHPCSGPFFALSVSGRPFHAQEKAWKKIRQKVRDTTVSPSADTDIIKFMIPHNVLS